MGPGKRKGRGAPFFAGAGLALLDACLRRDPPCAGALRQRQALHSAAASARILRLNADAAALRDLRFAVAAEPATGGKAAPAMARPDRPSTQLGRSPDWRRRRPPRPFPAAPDALAESLTEAARGGDPISAATKAAAAVFAALPDAPTAEAEVLALWAFDSALALRLRWPRPVPLIATKLLDPSLRSDGGGRRARPGDSDWPRPAASAIALAAASALDLAADLSRRADTLIAVAPKLRAKPAEKIVTLLLAQDCVSPAEAARQAPMTDRAARRLFDRLVALGAARELTGRPAFRLYGL